MSTFLLLQKSLKYSHLPLPPCHSSPLSHTFSGLVTVPCRSRGFNFVGLLQQEGFCIVASLCSP